MSQLTIRNTLLQALIDNADGVTIAYENQTFNPEGLDKFMSQFFIPATSESLGKTIESSDDERGIYQVSVFIKAGAPNYDNDQYEIIDNLKAVFYAGATFGEVDIIEVTLNNGSSDGAWFKRDLSISYSSYQGRG